MVFRYLKMKLQILDIDERSIWDDEVVGHWKKTSDGLKNYKDVESQTSTDFGQRQPDQRKICGEK